MGRLKDDLIAARALVDAPDKWVKGSFGSVGATCAMGAVAEATRQPMGGMRWNDCEAALIKALPTKVRGKSGHSVVAYNDNPQTTHADIMALFDRAIEAAA